MLSRRALAAAVALATALTAPATAVATSEPTPAEVARAIRVARDHLAERVGLLTNAPPAKGPAAAATPEVSAALAADAERLAERRARIVAANGGYARAEVTTSGEKAERTPGGGIALSVLEHVKLHFQRVEAGGPAFEEYTLGHTVSVTASGLLAGDVADVAPDGAPPLTRFDDLPVSDKGDHGGKAAASTARPALRPNSDVKADYSYHAMINYANAHWSSYNGSYRAYDNDCTNFISQAMRAGGWADAGGDRTGNSAWYYGYFTWTTSYTWAGAENWYWFARGHRVGALGSVWSMAPSDVLQVDFDRNGNINHTMIVTASDSSDLYLTYHSNNTHNRRLSTIIAAHPSAWFYAHRT